MPLTPEIIQMFNSGEIEAILIQECSMCKKIYVEVFISQNHMRMHLLYPPYCVECTLKN